MINPISMETYKVRLFVHLELFFLCLYNYGRPWDKESSLIIMNALWKYEEFYFNHVSLRSWTYVKGQAFYVRIIILQYLEVM